LKINIDITELSPKKKTLVLGTALWGWGINRQEAYNLLEVFLGCGGTIVDTATNYPINKCVADYGLALSWVKDWIDNNETSRLSLIVKIGSIDNMGSGAIDLSPGNVLSSTDLLREKFGTKLSCISVHWDDRGVDESNSCSIVQTVDAMIKIKESGLLIGMSGVKRPDLYLNAAPDLSDSWVIQVKENFSTRLARKDYQSFFPQAKYLAYGINLGGLKVESPQKNSSMELRNIRVPGELVDLVSSVLQSNHVFQPRPSSLNELALAISYVNPALSGVIIGPRNIEQLLNTMKYWEELKETPSDDKGSELFRNFSDGSI
jgi:aryl-alcohol dehydrogenase-like predicted oxidoreductase